MSGKVGRNDNCPCGSGKKFKKCCMEVAKSTVTVVDFAYRKLRETEGLMTDKHLGPYVREELPRDILKESQIDFWNESIPEGIDMDAMFNMIYLPWMFFNWIPEYDLSIAGYDSSKTVSSNYLKRHRNKLSEREIEYIKQMNKTHYSYYIVQEVEIDQYIVVKDIILGTTHKVKERLGTHSISCGNLIYSRILTMDDQVVFLGMAPMIIPNHFHASILDLKDWIIKENNQRKPSKTALRKEFDLALHDHFLSLLDAMYSPQIPQMSNTDGDSMQLETSYFEIFVAPQEALNTLLPLTLSDNVEEFLNDADFDKNGCIASLKLSWLKEGTQHNIGSGYTIMGEITIKPGQLVIDTNSEQRTKKAKRLLKKYLGKDIQFKRTVIESVKNKIPPTPKQSRGIMSNTMPKELLESPEMRAQIAQMAKDYYHNWLDEKIPALNDKTPRQAAKTAKDRERLEALLLQFETSNTGDPMQNLFKPDVAYLRSELGLD